VRGSGVALGFVGVGVGEHQSGMGRDGKFWGEQDVSANLRSDVEVCSSVKMGGLSEFEEAKSLFPLLRWNVPSSTKSIGCYVGIAC